MPMDVDAEYTLEVARVGQISNLMKLMSQILRALGSPMSIRLETNTPYAYSLFNLFVFSMASCKHRNLNEHLLERFVDHLDWDPSLIKSCSN